MAKAKANPNEQVFYEDGKAYVIRNVRRQNLAGMRGGQSLFTRTKVEVDAPVGLSSGETEKLKQDVALQKEALTSQEKQITRGLELGKEFIKEGELGRIDAGLGRVDTELGRVEEKAFREGKSADIQDVINRRRQALTGLSGEEQQIQRDRALAEIGRSEQLQQRQLQGIQAQQGLRGGTAASQQIQLLLQANQARSNFERDLFLENERIKREALTNFENSVTRAEAVESERKAANIQLSQFNLAQQLRERELQQFNLSQQQAEKQLEQFNLAQAAREKFGQLGVAAGFAGLLQADVASQRATEAQQAAAAAQSGGGK